jgi:UDP-N-acetylglucosamine 1-carboxyvinyltransferase
MTSGPETSYRVRGGAPLNGTVFIQGAKNAALKMIAASLLTPNGHTVLRNVPPIEDVRRAVELAQAVGALVEFHEAERTLVVDASRLTSPVLPAEIARRFRGSVLFVPALLHRFGEAVIEGVGGCNLGSRNLDFHYRGFARLGAIVDEGETVIHIKAGRLQGAHLYLDTPSHTGTENLIMAASLAPGRTIIDNTAQEPEVLDVIAFLTKMGARITGGGTGFITVHGVDELTAVEHTVMADRIDAGVFAMAAAITGGELNLVGASLDHFGVVRWKLEQMGVEFATNGAVLAVRRDRPLRPINVVTSPYPGFATDLQSPIMALACLADGASYIRETIYDGRYTLVGELNKMGAKVELDLGAVIVHGPSVLHGAEVVAHDLRTGIALVLAGLAAEGETIVTPGYPIDRGHANIAQRFSALGADIAAIPALCEFSSWAEPGSSAAGSPPTWWPAATTSRSCTAARPSRTSRTAAPTCTPTGRSSARSRSRCGRCARTR